MSDRAWVKVCENGPLALSEKRRRVRCTRRPGGPFLSEQGSEPCRRIDDADWEAQVAAHATRGPNGTVFCAGYLYPETKCVDPATEVAP